MPFTSSHFVHATADTLEEMEAMFTVMRDMVSEIGTPIKIEIEFKVNAKARIPFAEVPTQSLPENYTITPNKNAVSLNEFGYSNVADMDAGERQTALTRAMEKVGIDKVISKIAFLEKIRANSTSQKDRQDRDIFLQDFDWLLTKLPNGDARRLVVQPLHNGLPYPAALLA